MSIKSYISFLKVNFLFMTVAWSMGCFSLQAQSSNQLYDKAQEAFQNQRWKSASTLYTLLLQDSTHYTPLMGRKLMADMMSQDQTSLHRAEELVKKNICCLDSLLNDFSRLAIQMRHFDIFEETLLHMGKVLPAYKDSLLDIAVRYRGFLRQPDKVVSLIQQQKPEDERTEKWMQYLADAYQMLGNTSLALQEYEKILAINPDNQNAGVFVGNYYFLKGKNLINQARIIYNARVNPTSEQYMAFNKELQQIFDENLSKSRLILDKVRSLYPNRVIDQNISQIDQWAKELANDGSFKKAFIK